MSKQVQIPYLPNSGNITKILDKIKKAETPTNFNADFLGTKLGFSGGNNRMFISWAKKAGLLNDNGTPTALYTQFRNNESSKTALATALRKAYSELYSRNEYCHELDKSALKGLVLEATGESDDSSKVKMIVATFMNAKKMADFETTPSQKINSDKAEKPKEKKPQESDKITTKLGLNYTINLTLPKTDDPSVYDAIFRSLRENLLNQ